MPEQQINENNDSDRGQKLLEWKFTEYIKYERSTWWYVILAAIEILVIIYCFFAQNFLFALIAILVGVILVVHSQQQPPELDCHIFEDGVKAGNKFYEWEDIKAFRIVYEPPHAKFLYIDLKNVLARDFAIPLNDQNPLQVREVLKRYLMEDLTRPYESINERINRWLRL